MLYALLTLLLLAGAYILSLDRKTTLILVCIWTVGWICVRFVLNNLSRRKLAAKESADGLRTKAETDFERELLRNVSRQRKWEGFATIVGRTFGFQKAMVCLIRDDRCSVHVAYGMDVADVPSEFSGAGSDIMFELQQSGREVMLNDMTERDPMFESLIGRFGFTVIYPLAKEGTIHGVLLLGAVDSELSQEVRDSVQAFCNFASTQMFERDVVLADEPVATSDEPEQTPVREFAGINHFSDLVSRLYRIFNEEVLYETFTAGLRKLLRADFCYVLLPVEESQHLALRAKSGSVDEELSARSVDASSSIFDVLLRHPAAYDINHLLEVCGNDHDLRFLAAKGTDLLAPITANDDRVGLVGVSARRDGANGYSSSDRKMIESLSGIVSIVLENIAQFKKIQELSYTDSLTRLYNHRYFYKRLNEEILRAGRFKRFLGLAIFDIDNFKIFNDSYGHQMGDDILRQMGGLLSDIVRSIDIACRYGGEEFCVIMPETDSESCASFMERLRLRVAEHRFRNRFDGEHHAIEVSVGGAIFPSHAQRGDRLIYCADMALLDAKKAGRNVCKMYGEMS